MLGRAVLLLLGLTASSCASTSPCVAGSCDAEERCVLGGCQPPSRVPVGEASRRVVVFPVDVAAVTANLTGTSLPSVTFGARGDGDAAVFLSFDHELHREDDVEAAFVVLEATPDSTPASAWVLVEARDVPARFDGAAVDWARRPATGRPSGGGRTRGAAGMPLRVDVTEIVRGWLHGGQRRGQVALVARADADVGATFATGLGEGAAPRLEIYVR